MLPFGGGGVLGLAIFAFAARYLRASLFGVAPTDPVTLGSAIMLLAVAALASWLPAQRAARVDPAGTLRVE